MIRLGLVFLALFICIIIAAAALGDCGIFIFGPIFGPRPWYRDLLSELMFWLLVAGGSLCLFGMLAKITHKGGRL